MELDDYKEEKMKKICSRCGSKVKIIKWKCFNCGKEQSHFENEPSNMHSMLNCCLRCVVNIVDKKRRRMTKKKEKWERN